MMNTKMVSFYVFLLAILFSFPGYGDPMDSVSTFPFHLENKLLVFTGKMNGIETQFAFDTGAGMGLANSLSKPTGRLKIKGKKIKMRDSNRQVKKVPTGLTDEIQIGNYRIEKVRSLVNDMTLLYCLDYYLLGSNVINQLNWEIDFDAMQIRVSARPFPVEEEDLTFKVTYAGNRPFAEMELLGKKYERILVDFGYIKVMDFDDQEEAVQNFLAQKDSLGLSNPQITTSMGALGSDTYSSRTIRVDSLKLGEKYLSGIPIDFEKTSGSKIGLGFFRALTTKTIINSTDSTYALRLRAEPEFEKSTHLGVFYSDGKLIVRGKPLGLTPNDGQLEIGEEILSIDGKKASDFPSECSFIEWSFSRTPKELEIVKLDGTRLIFPQIELR
ncbi:aspartyl protease family protein [Algoriphagus confluentis]